MKLLITSPDALLDTDNVLYEGIDEALRAYKDLEPGNDVIVLSSHEEKLTYVPKEFNPIQIHSSVKGKTDLINILKENSPFKEINDIVILGANEKDFQLAVNNKILLLAAEFAKKPDTANSKIFEYGFLVPTVPQLTQIFLRLFSVKQPWFYSLEVSSTTKLFALTNANTLGYNRSNDIIQANSKFKRCLKDGEDTHRDAFTMYSLFSTYENVREFEQVKFWTIYPSSSNSEDPDLEHFKEIIRKSYKGYRYSNLFTRHKAAVKRSSLLRDIRIQDTCQSELESMHIRPEFKKNDKLEGQTVCVFDDFSSYGTSCEAARIMLEKAGVAKVIFVSMGKFGMEYYKQNYTIDGDVFTPNFKVTKVGPPTLISQNAVINNRADDVLLESLKGLI
ncbi:phosphoribosyltransferase [Pontibacter sp. CAU 1760]